jgi:hypothetical protein
MNVELSVPRLARPTPRATALPQPKLALVTCARYARRAVFAVVRPLLCSQPWHLSGRYATVFLLFWLPVPIQLSFQQWTRLIRFVAAETSQIHIGQPVDHQLDSEAVGLADVYIVTHGLLQSA